MLRKNHVRLGLLSLALVAAAVFPTPHAADGQTFSTPLNNASSVLASAHVAGSGTVALTPGTGQYFGSPTPDAPIRLTIAARSTLVNGQIAPVSTRTIYLVTGRSGDTLTGLTATEGTADRDYAKGDLVAVTITAGTIAEVQAAVGSIDSDVTELADSIDSVAETVATKADDAAAVHRTGDESIDGVKSHTSNLQLNSTAKLVANRPALDATGSSILSLDPGVTKAFQIGGQIVPDAGGPENRPHFVVGWGIGLDGANRPIDPNKTAIRYAQEYNFWNSGGINGKPPGYTHEFHLPEVIFPPYPTGKVIRPASILVDEASETAQIILGFSTLSLTDESVNALGGINKFDGSTSNFFLRSAVPAATNGTYFAVSAGAVNDSLTLGRGLGATQVFMNGTSAVQNFQLSGSTKWKVGVDTGLNGQMYKIGPLQTFTEQAWAAAGVSHHAFFERLRVGPANAFTAQVQVQPEAANVTGVVVQAASGQTADLHQLVDSAAAVRVRINKDANLIIKRNTAPADSDLNASEFSLWLEDTPGSTSLRIKAKDSAGTVRTGSIPLSWSVSSSASGRLAA